MNALDLVLPLVFGILLGCGLMAVIRQIRSQRELKRDLAEDKEIIAQLFARLAPAAAGDGPERADRSLIAVRRQARSSLELAERLAAQAARDAVRSTALALETEQGLRIILGAAKGLLDGADGFRPAAAELNRAARGLNAQAGLIVERLEGQLRRFGADFGLEEPAQRIARLARGLQADRLIIDSDPLVVLQHLDSQLRVVNEAADHVDAVLSLIVSH